MLLLVTVLVIGVYILVAPLLENLVARNLQSRLGLESVPEISLDGGPTSLLTGRFDGGRVVLPGFEFGDVRPEEVSIELVPFDLDLLGSLTSGQLQTRAPLYGTLHAMLSEAEVTRLASTGATDLDFPVRNVDLEEGAVVVASEAVAFDRSIPVSMEGVLDLRNNSLVLEPRRVEALGLPLPVQLFQGTSFVYPIEPLPGGGTFTSVEVQRDQLVLTGEISDLALL